MDQQARKEALKALKQSRAAEIKAAAAISKRQRAAVKSITERLAQGPATPPEVARDVDLSPREAMWYLAAMRKYGLVVEADKAGDYFNYQLTAPDPAAC